MLICKFCMLLLLFFYSSLYRLPIHCHLFIHVHFGLSFDEFILIIYFFLLLSKKLYGFVISYSDCYFIQIYIDSSFKTFLRCISVQPHMRSILTKRVRVGACVCVPCTLCGGKGKTAYLLCIQYKSAVHIESQSKKKILTNSNMLFTFHRKYFSNFFSLNNVWCVRVLK